MSRDNLFDPVVVVNGIGHLRCVPAQLGVTWALAGRSAALDEAELNAALEQSAHLAMVRRGAHENRTRTCGVAEQHEPQAFSNCRRTWNSRQKLDFSY